jgi:hypothetical protein
MNGGRAVILSGECVAYLPISAQARKEDGTMPTVNEYKGRCFCGAVELSIAGTPAAMGYCHCNSCRQWSAGPVNAFTLWPPSAVKISRGADQVGAYNKTDNSIRKWCKSCGDVYAAAMPEFPFQAVLHVNYGETVLPMHDGLPKQKDLPKEMGGTGTILPD